MIHTVRAHRLVPQPPGLPSGLPAEVAACAVAPAGSAWPEHRTRFVVEVAAGGGSGWHGPVSDPILALIGDVHADGLIGHDALFPRGLTYRRRAGRHLSGSHAAMAAAALELACWDLASRVTGVAVSGLLGGTVRAHVPAYASALGLDPTGAGAAEAAQWIVGAGFWGQKWPLPKTLLAQGLPAITRCLERLRAAVPESRVMVDAHRQVRADQLPALVAVLSELDITWLEEPALAPGPPGCPGSAFHRTVAVAGGEHAVEGTDQIRLLTSGEVVVWQPDPSWIGLSRALFTTDLATGVGAATFPHGGHLPAALHLAAACCRDMIPAVEYHLTLEPLRQAILTDPIIPDQGVLAVRADPGLADYRLSAGAPVVLAQAAAR
ncbi:enolase C-terminal domain-like protein [Actinomadura hibisca]|uniref:enolase C-terminal domain-like protein n=1 Tax=Actinomadura hibisca TaxID=68565 RepID=UPI001C3F45E4|nr:enolase C-terminal domain-like protein [Actinomadura hibisca]